jgi:hypothetical protein
MNWRGTPLVDLNTIVSLIGSTHSRAGLHVCTELAQRPVSFRIRSTSSALYGVPSCLKISWNHTVG